MSFSPVQRCPFPPALQGSCWSVFTIQLKEVKLRDFPACCLCLKGVTSLSSQFVVQTLQLLNKHLFMHIHTLSEIFTLIQLWGILPQLDCESPQFSCCRVSTALASQGWGHECHTSTLPACPPIWAPAHVDHPSVWAMGNTLLPETPAGLWCCCYKVR